MAINLPSNLYSGEAERINSLPHVQFQTQLLAHKAAKDEALDQYYRKLPETINEKGVRDQEVPVINQKKNDIQDFYMKNRQAIQNPKLDNGAAQFNLQKMYRDAGNIVTQSQNRAKTDLLIGKKRFEGGSEYMFQDPVFIQKLHNHSLPIGTPGSEEIDLANVAIPPPPFDASKQVKKYSDIKFDDGTPIVKPHPDNKYRNLEITPKVLGKEAKQAIYERAATDLENDPSFSKQIKETLAKSPDQLQAAAKTFQDNYGHEPQSDHDLAAGYMINILPKGEVKQRTFDNGLMAKESQQRGFAHQELMRNIGLADAKNLIDYREAAKAGGEESNNLWIDRYLSKIEEDNKPNLVDKFFAGGSKTIVPDPTLYKALGDPDEVMITPKGEYKLTFYKKEKNKDNILVPTEEIDRSKSGTFTKEQIKLALGYKSAGKKQLTQEMQSNQKSSTKPQSNKKQVAGW